MRTEPSGELVGRLRTAGCVFAEDEAELLLGAAAGDGAALEAMVARRCDGEPLELVIGWTDFCGVRVQVVPGVFIPRHRTELLVDVALGLTRPGDVVVDLCCGSGAIGMAIAAAQPRIELHAADIDAAAVACARHNLARVGRSVHQGDLFEALPSGLRGRVGVLCANVPYVPSGEVEQMPREARLFEPLDALDGGGDGLDVLRRVAADSQAWLRPGGHLLTETAAHQADTACAVLVRCGLQPEVLRDPDLDATVVMGRRP